MKKSVLVTLFLIGSICLFAQEVSDRYFDIGDFKNGLAFVYDNGKMGVIDENYQIVVPVEYFDIEKHHRGYKVYKGGNEGLLNEEGEIIIPPKYFSIEEDKEGRFWVYQNGNVGLLDENGNVLIPVKYFSLEIIGENLAKGFIQGKEVIIKF